MIARPAILQPEVRVGTWKPQAQYSSRWAPDEAPAVRLSAALGDAPPQGAAGRNRWTQCSSIPDDGLIMASCAPQEVGAHRRDQIQAVGHAHSGHGPLSPALPSRRRDHRGSRPPALGWRVPPADRSSEAAGRRRRDRRPVGLLPGWSRGVQGGDDRLQQMRTRRPSACRSRSSARCGRRSQLRQSWSSRAPARRRRQRGWLAADHAAAQGLPRLGPRPRAASGRIVPRRAGPPRRKVRRRSPTARRRPITLGEDRIDTAEHVQVRSGSSSAGGTRERDVGMPNLVLGQGDSLPHRRLRFTAAHGRSRRRSVGHQSQGKLIATAGQRRMRAGEHHSQFVVAAGCGSLRSVRARMSSQHDGQFLQDAPSRRSGPGAVRTAVAATRRDDRSTRRGQLQRLGAGFLDGILRDSPGRPDHRAIAATAGPHSRQMPSRLVIGPNYSPDTPASCRNSTG